MFSPLSLDCRYKNDPEILAMTNLIAAYQRNEILEFEKILKVNLSKRIICMHFSALPLPPPGPVWESWFIYLFILFTEQ